MRIGVRTGTQVVKVGPISFSISVNGDSVDSIKQWLRNLRSDHMCIAKTDVLDEYEILGTLPFVQTTRLTMDDDADYQQICALRAQLKYR